MTMLAIVQPRIAWRLQPAMKPEGPLTEKDTGLSQMSTDIINKPS